ncbi:MAG: DUF1501 domain-containing protein [Halieaceae bacterium]|nr:DUF1501 domain-containing protein [Halieaceae bacterium]
MPQNRRRFLNTLLSLPLASAIPTVTTLTSTRSLAADDDYRALVCVFLFGGMDCHDTVIPYDEPAWDMYAQLRAPLLQQYQASANANRNREDLLPLNSQGAEPLYALPREMSGLQSLFNQGQAAIVGNVGPLITPVDSNIFSNDKGALPKRLFSHNDQQSTWMAFAPEGAQLGWGGAFSDASKRAGINSDFLSVSIAGNTVFLNGEAANPFQLDASGVPAIELIEIARRQGAPELSSALEAHFAAQGDTSENLFARDFVNISRRALASNETMSRALADTTPPSQNFPQDRLGGQLAQVANTIAARQQLGASRQVFFVALGGFDTHDNQATDLPPLQQSVSDSITAFFEATVEMGVAQQVTTFTAADFGRTLTINGDGTDHGWGAHHFVVGGAVNGGRIYGSIPPPTLGHAQDAGNGRLIPTTSVEQYAAPLGRWFGLSENDLALALPGLAGFSAQGPAII